jgi:tRNA U38,U39,U40 pseudouridine synthase TruA
LYGNSERCNVYVPIKNENNHTAILLRYFNDVCEREFPASNMNLNNLYIKNKVRFMVSVFKNTIKGKRYVEDCKSYIDFIFKNIERSLDFSINKFSSVESITKFIKGNLKISNPVNTCKRFEMHCTHSEYNGTCRLGDGMCTKQIRNLMMEKFN